tara:strand:+ start:75 stop:626 length:552 start_codon:yes stop_codon:yes gene_type:complete
LKSLGGKIVCLGRIVGSQGLEGLARLRSYTAKPEDIGAYGPLVDENHNYIFNISVVRLSKKGVVAQIEGISSRTELEKFYGLDLYVNRSVLPELQDEQFYYSDLVGLLVNDIDGNFVGKVKSMENFGAGDIIEVEMLNGERFMLPFTKKVVTEINLIAQNITIDNLEDFNDQGQKSFGVNKNG